MGKADQPIAEKAILGWTLMEPGEMNTDALYFARKSQEDCYRLHSLDVLMLEDRFDGDQNLVHEEFREQLKRNSNGSYSTGLPWKAGHPPLPDNAECVKAGLGGLLKELKGKPEVLKQYHGIIQEQINQGIVEYTADEHEEDHVFYMPHKPVIRELAETTKMRIVYEASARENQKSPSLNDFLHVGPPLQPLLHDVLLRNRLKPIALTADMKQAFHQIWIDKKDRDAFRFTGFLTLTHRGLSHSD